MTKQVSYYNEFSSIVTYRIPVYVDGEVGQPEIKSKFTTAPKETNKRKVTKKVNNLTANKGGQVEL